jgi:signal transduction histidine kinase
VHHPHSVLIVADDPDFCRDLLARWELERNPPVLTAMSTEKMKAPTDNRADLAIVGPVRQGRSSAVLRALETGRHPVICIAGTAAQLHRLRTDHPRVLTFLRHEAWLDTVILLAAECLRRVDFATRLQKAERTALTNARHAALGRYMLETRHDFNNSLTSVLGNAELLLMDEAGIPNQGREQLTAIHEMALQMHAIMQRFSLIAAEVRTNEKESQDETARPSHDSFAVSGENTRSI